MGRKLRLSVHRKNEERKKKSAGNASSSQNRSVQGSRNSLIELHQVITENKMLPPGWQDVSHLQLSTAEEQIILCKLGVGTSQSTANLIFSINIKSNFEWSLYYLGEPINMQQSNLFRGFSSHLSDIASVTKLFDKVNNCKVCAGNPDEKFNLLSDSRQGCFKDKSGTKVIAYRENKLQPCNTIRHTNCEILLPSSTVRCSACSNHRKTLHAMLSRQSRSSTDKTSVSSHTNYRYLTSNEKSIRLFEMHISICNSKKQIQHLKAKLDNISGSVTVSADTHDSLLDTVKLYSNHISKDYPKQSFPCLFWEQQMKALTVKDNRAMRWHPLMIKWCLYLQHKSNGAYTLVRDSGVLKLPSQRTLKDYTHFIKAAPGFSATVDQQLMDAACVTSCPDYKKHIILLMDEMHVKEDLVYDKHTGALKGFTNIGDINSHLLDFEHSLSDDGHKVEPIANSVLVFMVRGLFSNLEFPYAQFPCKALTGEQIFMPFWEAVSRLERCDFKVMGVTADGLSANRHFFMLHNDNNDELTHKVINPYTSEERYIYLFSDPPHLLKTVRNCWASKKRNLWCNGKEIRWKHLEDLYQRNRGETGLVLVPKLKYEHIRLTAFSKMRVDLAAQVLSDSVSKAIKLTEEELEETSKFVDMFNKFFDCLNVSSFGAGKQSRNPFKSPYRSKEDFRLKWLEEEFMGYLKKWKSDVDGKRHTDKLKMKEAGKMLLSLETRNGLDKTVLSFVELVRYLFSVPGVEVFLSGKLCQDPLEKFFSCQRQRGRTNENPTVAEFLSNTQHLRVINSICKPSVHSNCRGDKRPIDVTDENTPLSRRKRSRK